VIPEIDIWRVANLMLKHYGDNAVAESARRVDELAQAGDHNCCGMAAGHRCDWAACEHHTSRTAALTRVMTPR
jgi:hypothetical protein